MGSSHRIAAVAAVSHARRYYNHTQTDVLTDVPPYGVNVLFVSATICGVLVAVCTACWRRASEPDKPDDGAGVLDGRAVYTVSTDARLNQVQDVLPSAGPPPAYESVVDDPALSKDCTLEEVITEPCPRCIATERCDSGLPSYEAAVMLKDTKL